MTGQLQTDALDWRDGDVPVARRFDDPYFSLENGLAETRHTFLAGNGLPGRFAPDFHVAELGFGTGLNLLTTWAAWEDAGINGPLRLTSFEAFPMQAAEMARALSAFSDLEPWCSRFFAAWDAVEMRASLPTLDVQVIVGDARRTVPKWDGQADAWFLDGFSPAKNPELWEDNLMAAVGRHTASRGTCATYTAAGHVRRALEDAGFTVQRVPGYGRKRHMTCGVLR
ncbi:MAG: tRNA (5-methylaminomethyl-2-thiouridine)(34)-methyltransferase MnmD [Pseudomonadota bacterium]